MVAKRLLGYFGYYDVSVMEHSWLSLVFSTLIFRNQKDENLFTLSSRLNNFSKGHN